MASSRFKSSGISSYLSQLPHQSLSHTLKSAALLSRHCSEYSKWHKYSHAVRDGPFPERVKTLNKEQIGLKQPAVNLAHGSSWLMKSLEGSGSNLQEFSTTARLQLPCGRGAGPVAGFPSRAPFHILPVSYVTVTAFNKPFPTGSDYPVLHLQAPSLFRQEQTQLVFTHSGSSVTPCLEGECTHAHLLQFTSALHKAFSGSSRTSQPCSGSDLKPRCQP